MKPYIKKTWLSPHSTSTSSVVAFSGTITHKGKKFDDAYLEIADCRGKVNLHITDNETREDFISKMKLLRAELDSFINHLETEPCRKS